MSLAARLVLAGVLAYAALTKIGDPAATVRAVRAYQLLPEALAVPFAHALPPIELALAVLLLLGVAVRLSGVATAILMGAFIVGVASAAARGLQIDCGCFGGGGPTDDPQYALELARDGAFLALAVLVAALPRSPVALDPNVPASSAGAGTRRDRVAAAAAAKRAARRLKQHRLAAASVLALTALIAIAVTPSPDAGRRGAAPAGATEAGGFSVGEADAPRHLVVFEDMQCPVCATFENLAGPALDRAVDAGTVRVEYRIRSFLGEESVRAAAALAAASDIGADEFKALHAELFASQPDEHSGGYSIGDLLAAAERAALTGDSWRALTLAYQPYLAAVPGLSGERGLRGASGRPSQGAVPLGCLTVRSAGQGPA